MPGYIVCSVFRILGTAVRQLLIINNIALKLLVYIHRVTVSRIPIR